MTASSAAQPDTQQEPRPSWLNPLNWPMGIWVLVICLGLMLVPFGIRAIMLAGTPMIPEPFDVAEFCKWNVSADDDAFTEYRVADAMRMATRVVAPESYDQVQEKGWTAADDAVKQWLELNRDAMAVWRKGTQKELGLNISPGKMAFDTVIDTVQAQREFARLALVEEARCLDAGELDEARQWARATFRAGGHSTRRGCLVQALVGSAIHSVSTTGLAKWAEQPGVTSTQLQEALSAAKSDYALYELRSNIMKAEYLAVCNTLAKPAWIDLLGPVNSGSAPTSPAMASVMKMGFWVVGEPELSVRIFRQVLANQLVEIDKPVSQRQKLGGSGFVMVFDQAPNVPLKPAHLDVAGINRACTKSFLVRLLAPAAKNVDNALLRQEARQAVFEVLLAAQAYRRDHGEFPENLSLLVPKYIATIPLDPCDPSGGQVLYRRDEPLKAVIYSVGDDGADGGGDFDSKTTRPADVGFDLK